jgi:hypothetical protein
LTTNRHDFWKRYSLRGLFVLMTLCCVILGLWSAYVHPFRRQANAIATLERLPVEVGFVSADGPAWQRWLVTTMLGDDAYVIVDKVELRGPNVNDEVVRELAGLDWLSSLSLEQTQVTDVGLGVLRSLHYVQDLSLTYSQVTDGGLEQLKQLPQLRYLKLTGTPITDGAVPTLADLPALQTLFVRWTRITDEGAGKLRELAPTCEVHHHELAVK